MQRFRTTRFRRLPLDGRKAVAPPVGIKFGVTSNTFNTNSKTTQDLSAGFAETPKAALFAHAHSVGSGTIVPDGGLSVSVGDGSTEALIAGRSEDGQATSDCQYWKNSLWAVGSVNESALSPLARATPTFPSGGTTRLTWDMAAAGAPSDWLGGVLHMGGDNLSAKQSSVSVTASTDGTFGLTGVGFAPDVMIALCGPNAGGSGTLVPDNTGGVGFAVRGGSQASCNFRSRNGLATTSVASYMSNAWALTALTTSGAQGLEVTSWDSDGVTLTARNNGWSWGEYFLFLKLDSNADAAVSVIDWPTSTGVQTYAVGFRPRVVLMATVQLNVLNTYAVGNVGLVLSIIGGSTQVCSAMVDQDGAGTSATHGVQTNKALKVPDITGSTWWEADFAGFVDNGFRLNFTTVHTVARKAIVLALR